MEQENNAQEQKMEQEQPVEATETQMESAEDETPKPVHHQTVEGANLAVARKEISADSCRAVIAGEISLAKARRLGRDHDRHGMAVGNKANGGNKTRTPKKDKPVTLCLACGKPTKGGRFHPGADMKMHRIADEHLRGERELTPEQREYLESSGKLEQARKRAEKDETKTEAKRVKATEQNQK